MLRDRPETPKQAKPLPWERTEDLPERGREGELAGKVFEGQIGGAAARGLQTPSPLEGPPDVAKVDFCWCAVNACVFQRVEVPPGKGRLPRSNRSGEGGNEFVGAFDGKGHLVTPRRCRP